MERSEFVAIKERMWPWLQLVLAQHFIGGLLCLPSILSLTDPKTGASLACLAIVSEMGWEIQDILGTFYKRLFTQDGKKTVPDILLIILPMHHSLTTSMAIPIIRRYRNLRTLHWLCFDLQGAAAVSLFVGEYTKLLDVSKPHHLRQFQVLTGAGLIMNTWTRGFHWVYLLFQFYRVFIEEENWTFLAVGLPVGLIFSCFSYFICIEPFYKRFRKFILVSDEYQKLPSDVSPAQRRASLLELQDAALALSNAAEADLAADMIAAMFVERKVSRRETMPASYVLRQQARRLSNFRASTGSSSLLSSQLQEELEELDRKAK
jgi:hypothetical protein